METLADLGERRILAEIIPKYVTASGDDCILVPSVAGYTVASTDPAPTPAAYALCGDDNPYWQGWLLATINVSDIASMGANPTSFLASLDLPKEYLVSSFEQLLMGIRAGCDANGIVYAGGNIRESRDANVTLVGTALGNVNGYEPLTRLGAKANEQIYVVGKVGKFWSDYGVYKNTNLIDKDTSPIFSPVAQASQMQTLAAAGVVSSAMDISDGLVPSLTELAEVNKLDAIVDVNNLNCEWVDVDCSTQAFGCHERVFFGWGDWCVLCSVSNEKIECFTQLCEENNIDVLNIGEFSVSARTPSVYLKNNSEIIEADRLESERFAKDSWFQTGIQGYVDLLSDFHIPT